MKPVTRRDFLKGLAAGAVSVGAFGLAGTANTAALAEDASAVLYQPGTYSSTQATEFAKVEVSCTFSEKELTDVSYKLLETSTDDYFAKMDGAVQAYCQRIRDAGSTAGVDGISGASLCTAAIRDGVNACRAQALGVVLPTAPAGGAKVINPQSTDFHSNSSPDLSKTALFSDWQLGGRTFNHRMVKSAAFQLAFLRHNPDEYINYYKRMADGGVQMIWIEDFADIWEVTSGGPFKAPLDHGRAHRSAGLHGAFPRQL